MVTQTPLKGLVFDLDNTLIDRASALRAWLNAKLPNQPALINHAIIQDNLGYSPRPQWCDWLARHHPDSSEQLWEQLRTELGRYVPHTHAHLGALKQLSQRYTLAILSNGGSFNQRLKLQSSGLSAAFEPQHIFISEELGLAKPAPQAFLHVCEQLQCAPHELLFIGDHPIHDIQAPQALGFKTAWIALNRPWTERTFAPDLSVSNLAALLDLLNQEPTP